MVKSTLELTYDLPWTNDFNFFFESDTLVFTIFVVKRGLSENENLGVLQSIFQGLEGFLKPWLNHYPWGDSCLEFELVEKHQPRGIAQRKVSSGAIVDPLKTYSYIFGTLLFGTIQADEWLVVSLLLEFFQRTNLGSIVNKEDIYLHFFDQDGEFLLAETADYIPEWCAPSNSFNRLWINGNGTFLLIDPREKIEKAANQLEDNLVSFGSGINGQDAEDELDDPEYMETVSSLMLFEALHGLEYPAKVNSTALADAQIHLFKEKLNVQNCVETALQYIINTEVLIDREVAQIFIGALKDYKIAFGLSINPCFNPNMISKSLGVFVNQLLWPQLNNQTLKRFTRENNDLVELNISIPFIWHHFCKEEFRKLLELHNKPFRKPEFLHYLGQCLTVGLDHLVESDAEIEKIYNDIVSDISSDKFIFGDGDLIKYNKYIKCNPLQQELRSIGLINSKVNPIDPEKFAADLQSVAKEEENKLNNVASDDKVMENIKLFIEGESKPSETFSEKPFNIDLNAHYNDDSDYDSDKEDKEVLSYFKKQNVTINEDDFFEFFLTEGLKIPKEQLNDYRATVSKEEKESSVGDKRKSEFPDEESDALEDDLNPEDMKSLTELVKLLRNNGAPGDPGAAFFQSFVKE